MCFFPQMRPCYQNMLAQVSEICLQIQHIHSIIACQLSIDIQLPLSVHEGRVCLNMIRD